MDTELEESIDFDFFDVPRRLQNEPLDSSSKAIVSKPPSHPRSAKTIYNNSLNERDMKINDTSLRQKSPPQSGSSRSSSPEFSSSSDGASESELNRDEKSSHRSREKSCVSDTSSSSVSGLSYSDDRSPSLPDNDVFPDSPRKSLERSKNSRSNHNESDSEERATNPMAKGKRIQQGEDGYDSSVFSDGDNCIAKTSSLCDDNGDYNINNSSMKKGNKRLAWGESTGNSGTLNSSSKYKTTVSRDRPKTARGSRGRSFSVVQKQKSESDSDSDITDVSSIESPRNGYQVKHKEKKGETLKMSAAGDGGHVKVQYQPMPITELDLPNNDEKQELDRDTKLDLQILMKAVGELEKQKRLQTNSRRVLFAPTTVKRTEKANYTFDQKQTRDIERENQRLLMEIVRRVQSGEQKKQFYRTSTSYKLTPSSVNRDKESRKIESENLAFLKRLQSVKPTKSICREQQLKTYEKTTLYGVPIAALHPMPRGERRAVINDSASSTGSHNRSLSSLLSGPSTYRSGESRSSSRPGSATKRPASATKRVDIRPEWSDRW